MKQSRIVWERRKNRLFKQEFLLIFLVAGTERRAKLSSLFKKNPFSTSHVVGMSTAHSSAHFPRF